MRLSLFDREISPRGRSSRAYLCHPNSLRDARLIDFDPQAHATMGLNLKPAELEKSIYDVIKPGGNGYTGINDIIIPIREHFDPQLWQFLHPINCK